MCGIAGFWTDPFGEAEARQSLTRMTDAMVHRGPDAAGAWLDASAGIALGHRRLAIVELSPLGAQPMASPTGRYQLVFNGEIYNFRALRRGLERDGYAFRGQSDTEVLLALIERDGLPAALEAAVGMFAIALWDRATRTLSLARDRFGEKPLYVGRCTRGIAFGSELSVVREAPGVSGTIDRQALAAFVRHGYVPAPLSILDGVSKLEPGTIMTLRTPSIEAATVSRYWCLRTLAESGAADPSRRSHAELTDDVERVLRQAVGDQMLADVPLGAFLSGGIDSSLIVALMQAQSARPVRTFSVGFHEPEFDEAPYAADVARHLGTEHTTMYVTAADALDVIPRLAHIYSEPFADSSQIPTTLVAALARQHVTVALSGDGGDELFGGYARYAIGLRTWPRLTRIPLPVRRATRALVTSMSARSWNAALAPVRLAAPGITGDRLRKLATLVDHHGFAGFYQAFVSGWRSPLDLVPGAQEPAYALLQPFNAGRGGLLGEMMFRDQVSYLPDDILVKVDRAAMAASLETRAPLLDHRVAEVAWRLPADAWQRHGQGKWILRQVLDRYVPRALVERPKRGFAVPLTDWLRGPLRDWADDLLNADTLRRDGVFAVDPIVRTWSEHRRGERAWPSALWPLLMFQAWRHR